MVALHSVYYMRISFTLGHTHTGAFARSTPWHRLRCECRCARLCFGFIVCVCVDVVIRKPWQMLFDIRKRFLLDDQRTHTCTLAYTHSHWEGTAFEQHAAAHRCERANDDVETNRGSVNDIIIIIIILVSVSHRIKVSAHIHSFVRWQRYRAGAFLSHFYCPIWFTINCMLIKITTTIKRNHKSLYFFPPRQPSSFLADLRCVREWVSVWVCVNALPFWFFDVIFVTHENWEIKPKQKQLNLSTGADCISRDGRALHIAPKTIQRFRQ